MSPEASAARAPTADFHYLDTLWFQISGTLCNIRCSHCFISCAPDNHDLEMLELEKILSYMQEAKQLAVKEIYFTGGEPFIHRDIFEVLEASLRDFPTTVLTNGLPITSRRADRLEEIAAASRFSLEIRVSIDDYDEKRNDAIRGQGTFRRALAAFKRLSERGFLPILAVTEIRSYLEPRASVVDTYQRYFDLLKSVGVDRPRIKMIPVFEMGMLPLPSGARLLDEKMMREYDHSLLQCSASRIVAQDGVYACPILVGQKKARMSAGKLRSALRPCDLYHSSCTTCYVTGMTCKNF